ncbi:MAG TPA: hypothetical protein VGN83_14875 [Falsiroseomonas sp.]|jgi:hypothetical protein|nr:hypothetical protein [Falsiroseomonas sp.]
MTNHAQSRPETAPRELTAAEMQQAGGGASDPEWRYVPVRRLQG